VFAFGTIVLTRFPFTDLSGAKRRPALVVSRDNDRRPDLVVCFITSVPRTGRDMAPLPPTPGTGLKVPSVVRFESWQRSIGRLLPASWARRRPTGCGRNARSSSVCSASTGFNRSAARQGRRPRRRGIAQFGAAADV